MAKTRRGRSLKRHESAVFLSIGILCRMSRNTIVSLRSSKFKSVTAGRTDGSIMGVNGSINAVSKKLILESADLDSLGVNGNVVCDLGKADGKFMVCAFLAGAQRVVGVEFAENRFAAFSS
jgi:hypothetical protein